MILYIVNGGALTLGTSSRKKIPRLKDELDEVEYDENDNMNLADFKKIISKLLFPHGRKSIQCSNIVNSMSSPIFAKSIKKIISLSNNYKALGLAGFGIPNFGDYSFEEQVDLIADVIVESENPELKQSIKDIIYDNGIEGTFGNTVSLIIEVFKKYIERKIQGYLVEEFAERNEKFTDKNFYILLDTVISESISRILTIDNVNNLILNHDSDSYITNWADSNVNLILEGAVI